MADVLVRKCAKCKGEIVIHKNSISNVIQFQNKYYHYDCFENLATAKAASKRGKPQMWQEALDNIWLLEGETRRQLEYYWTRDDLNEWLLSNYDIIEVPRRIFNAAADLEMGKYQNRKCKPVPMSVLYECWKWCQKKLNEVNQYNRSRNKGPTNDSDRLAYDLSIVLGKVPQFLAHKEKQKAAEFDRQIAQRENININYDKIKSVSNNNNGLDDISDLLNDLI